MNLFNPLAIVQRRSNPFDQILKLVDNDFCLDDTPDFIQAGCGVELGGIPFVGLIHPSIVIDETDLSTTLESAPFWTNGVGASPSKIFVLLNTRGSKAPGTPTEEDGFGFLATERTGDDKELAFEVLGVKLNRRFWASVNQRRNWQLIYGTAGQDENGDYTAFYAKNVSIYGDEAIDQSIKSRIRTSASAKWSTAMVPSLPFSFPASVIADLSE